MRKDKPRRHLRVGALAVALSAALAAPVATTLHPVETDWTQPEASSVIIDRSPDGGDSDRLESLEVDWT